MNKVYEQITLRLIEARSEELLYEGPRWQSFKRGVRGYAATAALLGLPGDVQQKHMPQMQGPQESPRQQAHREYTKERGAYEAQRNKERAYDVQRHDAWENRNKLKPGGRLGKMQDRPLDAPHYGTGLQSDREIHGDIMKLQGDSDRAQQQHNREMFKIKHDLKMKKDAGLRGLDPSLYSKGRVHGGPDLQGPPTPRGPLHPIFKKPGLDTQEFIPPVPPPWIKSKVLNPLNRLGHEIRNRMNPSNLRVPRDVPLRSGGKLRKRPAFIGPVKETMNKVYEQITLMLTEVALTRAQREMEAGELLRGTLGGGEGHSFRDAMKAMKDAPRRNYTPEELAGKNVQGNPRYSSADLANTMYNRPKSKFGLPWRKPVGIAQGYGRAIKQKLMGTRKGKLQDILGMAKAKTEDLPAVVTMGADPRTKGTPGHMSAARPTLVGGRTRTAVRSAVGKDIEGMELDPMAHAEKAKKTKLWINSPEGRDKIRNLAQAGRSLRGQDPRILKRQKVDPRVIPPWVNQGPYAT
jgi:hypothetical protein